MDQLPPGNSLPKIRNKRAYTEGSTIKGKKHHRFSFQLNENKLQQYRSIYNSRHKEQDKITKPYAEKHLPNKLQQTDPLKVKHKKQLEEIKEEKDQKDIVQFRRLKEIESSEKESASCKFTFNNVLLSVVQNYYLQQIKKKPFNQQTISVFIQLLQDNNSILKKINPVIIQSLLKLGFITSYEHGEVIYRQGSPIHNIGIILWGEAVLKKQNSKFRFSCYPGYGIGEEILFEQITDTQTRSSNIQKGKFLTYEKCKSAGTSGILFVGQKQYSWMSEELILRGLKQVLMKFQSLLLRSYLKKRDKRLLFG